MSEPTMPDRNRVLAAMEWISPASNDEVGVLLDLARWWLAQPERRAASGQEIEDCLLVESSRLRPVLVDTVGVSFAAGFRAAERFHRIAAEEAP